MTKALKIYVAGKVSKDSHFGRHDWRDAFVAELARLSGRELINLDPTKSDFPQDQPKIVFGGDAWMISECDALIVYLSDDISIGGSQEILIAKHFAKPVIGLAPIGGKFNGSTKEYFGKVIQNYQDPFVFSTCDIVCATTQEVAESLKTIETIEPKTVQLINDLVAAFKVEYL
jgi:hypothetical protein